MSKKYFLIVTTIILVITATSWMFLSSKPKVNKYMRATLVLYYINVQSISWHHSLIGNIALTRSQAVYFFEYFNRSGGAGELRYNVN